MDPDACFRRMLEALDSEDGSEVEDACDDLIGWLDKGGALPAPSVLHGANLGLMSRAGLRAVLDLIRCAAACRKGR
jgi:hypothetical protein